MLRSIDCNFCNTRCSDSTLWHIDDTAYRKIILSVRNRFQIRKHIFYFFAGVEIYTTYDLIRDVRCNKPLLKKTRLRIGAI